MSPKEKTVVRAIVKALRMGDTNDLAALSTSYGVARKLDNMSGRMLQSADLLEALVAAKES